jgi:hypothetical protein
MPCKFQTITDPLRMPEISAIAVFLGAFLFILDATDFFLAASGTNHPLQFHQRSLLHKSLQNIQPPLFPIPRLRCVHSHPLLSIVTRFLQDASADIFSPQKIPGHRLWEKFFAPFISFRNSSFGTMVKRDISPRFIDPPPHKSNPGPGQLKEKLLSF